MQADESISLGDISSVMTVSKKRDDSEKGRSTVDEHDSVVGGETETGYLKLSFYDRVALKACTGLAILTVLVFLFEYLFYDDTVRFQSSPWALLMGLAVFPSLLFALIWLLRSRDREREIEREAVSRHRESFENALQLIGDLNVSVRVGAIYSLGRLLDGKLIGKGGWSIEDHNSVIEILAGYIRTNLDRASRPKRVGTEDELPLDVRSALSVLGKRRWNEIPDEANLDFAHVNFQEVNLYRANLRGTNFFEARLRGAMFKEAKLEGANFARAFLNEVNFKRAELKGVCFSGASLIKAKLRGADLSDSNLAGAVLAGADLRGANLRNANLQGASLSGANLKGTMLDGADFTGTYYSKESRLPNRFDPEKSGMYKSDY